ncbi:scoloptoxin SSD14-like isoform X2 [Aphis gossypii]|uniref:scoloptoxin SSD14-like isoform X2 n=1 Tax=Aphis gossypii TaxID=80765 RepID=UPI002159AB38|nr:scoloptoxin SSD14-like isoform X2 [Aphis gossypii]XP_027844958.2 scoloptoxin SSD14-like isoform X2 [Aphis gossypii]XP_027844959.2 scoloptoxin SSD14-like isoform X2 [Aphis gossypii]XP_027844960.2 scoloptoxin SSD14-like isoform X2 [Aphis gossypii]XP_027844961.2 scoloptoxin SSD14-like isoform X2 [Aphis gossypii]XP_050067038.1 scoloptoxin SSD14-like isoform X2 [Aphis gossypii]
MMGNFRSKTCIVLLVVVVLIAAISVLFVYTRNGSDGEKPDPEHELPPSFMPMGSYSNVGVVSNGGPCAQIGVDVMAKGGNAVDAAIATMLCDGVLCPEYMGIGGGFLMSIYDGKTKKVTTINARESAPAAATAEMFVKYPEKSILGGLAIAVPGELKGYSTIFKSYGSGKVSWKSLFEPTIELCENGIQISDRLEINMKNHEELIKNDPFLRRAFFDEKTGHVKKSGEHYTLPKLAETLKIVSVEGAEAIYNGSLTKQLVEDIKKVNGIITEKDLANYEVEVKESMPVHLKSGHTIHLGPPPSSGVILAYILRILDGILPAPNPGLDAHRFVEAFKFGFGERTHLGDHNFVNVTNIYDKITNDSYIDSIRNKISDTFTSLDPKYYGADYDSSENHGTANIVVTDSNGNTVVGTSTLNIYFGSGFVSPSTGINLNNEMDDFSTPGVINYYGIPSSPANFIAPGKRPMSSMCPTIITNKDGDFVLGAGAAGGSKITLATSYVTALKLWYNMTLKEVIDKPRIYHQLMPMVVQYEYGTTKSVVQTLKDIGHPVSRLKNTIGSAATAIAKSSSGMIETMPDWRRPGNSSGY